MTPPKTPHLAFYRAHQFFAALKAYLPAWAGGLGDNLAPAEAQWVKSILPRTAQQRLFKRMPPNDRRHAIAVARTLQQAGHNHPALLQAALLHDIAKSMGQPLIHRVLIVLLEAFWPRALQRLSTPTHPSLTPLNEKGVAAGWRRPFIIHAQHPAIGAAWAEAANCDLLAVHLIARHQDMVETPEGEEERLLALLQWADDLN